MYEKLSRLQSEKKKRKKKKENDARDERKKEKKRKKIKEAERRKCERQRGSTDTFHSATSTINPFYLISFSREDTLEGILHDSLSTVLRKIP